MPDSTDLNGLVGGPDGVDGPVVGRAGDAVGELLEGLERDVPRLGFAEDLDGRDLVAVLVQVRLPGVDDGAGPGGVDDPMGVEQRVDGDLVDRAVVGLP